MEVLNSLDDVDSRVTRNPNSVLIVYKEGCPWCEKLKSELEKLENDGKAKIYLIDVDKAGGLVKKLGARGVPVTIAFRECEVNKVFEGYTDEIIPKLEEIYRDALPVCRVDLSQILFDTTNLGEPIL